MLFALELLADSDEFGRELQSIAVGPSMSHAIV